MPNALNASYIKNERIDTKLINIDYVKDARDEIQNGYITSAIAQRPFSWGSKSIEMMAEIFEGQTVQSYLDTGTYEVNQSNLKIFDRRFT